MEARPGRFSPTGRLLPNSIPWRSRISPSKPLRNAPLFQRRQPIHDRSAMRGRHRRRRDAGTHSLRRRLRQDEHPARPAPLRVRACAHDFRQQLRFELTHHAFFFRFHRVGRLSGVAGRSGDRARAARPPRIPSRRFPPRTPRSPCRYRRRPRPPTPRRRRYPSISTRRARRIARAVRLAPPGTRSGRLHGYAPFGWTFGDDGCRRYATRPGRAHPAVTIGSRSPIARQYRLFFDNLNSRYSGSENLTHLVMYKEMPSFFPASDDGGRRWSSASNMAALSAPTTGNLKRGALRRRVVHPHLPTNTGEFAQKRVFPRCSSRSTRIAFASDTSLRHQLGRHRLRIDQPVDFCAHPGLVAGAQGAIRITAFLCVRRVQDGDHRAARTNSEPGRRKRRRDHARRRDELRSAHGGPGADVLDQKPAIRLWARGYFQQGQVLTIDDVRGKNVYTYGRLRAASSFTRTCRCRSPSTSGFTGTTPPRR